MKCIFLSLTNLFITGYLIAQIPSPDTLNKSGSIELNEGSIRFLKVDNPVFAWDFETQKNQLNLINLEEEKLFQINLDGNAALGDTLDDDTRFKLTLSSPVDGDTTYSAGGSDPAAMLRLIELQETKFGRIHFNNKNSSEYWQIQSRSDAQSPETRFYWSGSYDPNGFEALPSHTILGIKRGQVTVNGTSPQANLHIVQTSKPRRPIGSTIIEDIGLGIENYAGTALWRFQVGVDDLALIFNETHMGSFSASSGFYNPSDGRLKNSIESVELVLPKVLELKPSTYYYNHEINPKTKSYGFIAQEVQAIFPDLVVHNEINDMLMINYDQFIPILTKSIQELKTIIDDQQRQIEALRGMVK